MTPLAPLLEAFFKQHLIAELQASQHTVAAYRDAFRLLLSFAQKQTQKAPSKLDLTDIDPPFVGAFLMHLEVERQNTARTRNARLAAIHSFYRFLAPRVPEHAGLIQQVLAIPMKRCEHRIVDYLTEEETTALLAAPDRATWFGRRDHALLLLTAQTGMRVSEIIGLTCQDLDLGERPSVRCLGKGRKERTTPLNRSTAAVLQQWMRERGGNPGDPLFPSRRGTALSRDGVERIVKVHAASATKTAPGLQKKRVSPHVLRHTNAVQMLKSGTGEIVLALWLGHQSPNTTKIYVNADLSIKERALERTAPPNSKPGRYRPPDPLLAVLEAL